ncbi:MAG: hypothetical protein ACK5LL_13460 [Suipraeoptans sp.]
MKKVKENFKALVAILFAIILACSGSVSTITANASTTTPTNLKATYYSMGVTSISVLQWESVSNASSYRLYRSNAENGEYTLAYDGKGRSHLEDHSLDNLFSAGAPKDVRFYKVSAVVNGTESKTSAVICNRPELAKEANQAANTGGGTITNEDEKNNVNLPAVVEEEPEVTVPEVTVPEEPEVTVPEVTEPEVSGELGVISKFAAAAIGTTRIELTWEAAANADYYEISRSMEGGSYVKIKDKCTDLKYIDDGLTPNTIYAYRIRAYRGSDKTHYFGPREAKTWEVAGVPTKIEAKATGTTTIDVNWNAGHNAESYTLSRSLKVDDGYEVIAKNITGTTYKDTGLNPGTRYYYKVVAVANGSVSEFVGPADATTWKILGTPATITATGTTTIDVNWSAAANADSYKLYRSTAANGTYTQIGGTLTSTKYTDADCKPATTYYYKVKAVGQGIESGFVGPANATTWKTLGLPSNITATATGTTTITVKWNVGTNATGYKLYRSTAANGTYTQIGGTLTSTTYYDTGRTPGTTYYYKVKSVGQNQESALVGPANATTWKILGLPANITATATGTTTITVKWNVGTNATGYKLYRSTAANGTYTQIGGTLTSTTYYDTGRTPGTTYYYKVKSVGQNQESALVGPANATTWKTLGLPSNITATATGTSTITVKWNVGINAASYKLYRSLSANGTYTQIGGTLTSTTYYDTGLNHNTTYYYKVQAVGQNQVSALVGPANATTWKIKQQPSAFYPLLTNSCCRIHVNIVVTNNTRTFPTEIAGFEVYMYTNQSEASPPSSGWTMVTSKSINSSTVTAYGNGLSAYAGNMIGIYPNRYHYKYRFRYTDGTYSEFSKINRMTTLSGTFGSCAGRNHGSLGWHNNPVN